MNKVTPITYKAKNASPFKISQGLVEGAENLYGSMNKVKGQEKEKEKETKPSPGNNQQPSNPPPPDLTETGSKKIDQTNDVVEKENKIVEEFKPNDVTGFFNNILKNMEKS